jgi:hypothetical protein
MFCTDVSQLGHRVWELREAHAYFLRLVSLVHTMSNTRCGAHQITAPRWIVLLFKILMMDLPRIQRCVLFLLIFPSGLVLLTLSY